MPLIRTGMLILASILFGTGGSALMAAPEPVQKGPGPDSCRSRLVRNAIVPGVKPDKLIRNPKEPTSACYTKSGMEAFAKQVACDSGYALANLINIRESGYWMGNCYQADVEFYRSDSGARIAPVPAPKIDSVPSEGFQALATLDLGSMVAGEQARSGITNQMGQKALTSQVEFGLAVRYYSLANLGIEAETAGRIGFATAPGTNSMAFTQAWISRFGLSVIPWQRLTPGVRFQFVGDGGLNYVRLSFANEFKDFVESQAPVQVYDQAATGTGWYAGAQLRAILSFRLLGEIGGRYEAIFPKFPGSKADYSGHSVSMHLGIGYLF